MQPRRLSGPTTLSSHVRVPPYDDPPLRCDSVALLAFSLAPDEIASAQADRGAASTTPASVSSELHTICSRSIASAA